MSVEVLMKASLLNWFHTYDLLVLVFITFVIGILLLPTHDFDTIAKILGLMGMMVWNCVFHQIC